MEYQPHDIASRRPERHSHADLRNALADHVCQHAVNADTGEHQRQPGEHAECHRQEALAVERVARELLHGTNSVDRLIAGCSAQVVPERFDHIQWWNARAGGYRHE